MEGIINTKTIMETKNKGFDKSRLNAEEDYITTPISVLRYISDLETEVKQLSIADAMYWRDIRKEMPPEHENVLVRLDGDIHLLGIMDSNNQWGIYWQDGRNAEDPYRPVTHWMPIPACI